MTQELNKEGLDAALIAYEECAGFIDDQDAIEAAIHAYLNTAKVTGFESRVSKLFEDDTMKPHRWIVEAGILIRDMQAALAGGSHD